MLCQYQLHGGIRRLQTRFDQSKRFGTTTTMAASAAPTPWNRPPPSIGDFRWWEEDFLKLSRPLTSEEAPIVHRTKYAGEPPHGLLVPAFKELSFCLDEPCFKKRQGRETKKTASISCPQTTLFHQNSRIRRHRPKNCSTQPIPPSYGDIRLPHQGVVDLHGREPQRCQRCDRAHLNSHFHRV